MSLFANNRDENWNYFKNNDFRIESLDENTIKDILNRFNLLMMAYINDRKLQKDNKDKMKEFMKQNGKKFDEEEFEALKDQFVMKQMTWLYDNKILLDDVKQKLVDPKTILSDKEAAKKLINYFSGTLNIIRNG